MDAARHSKEQRKKETHVATHEKKCDETKQSLQQAQQKILYLETALSESQKKIEHEAKAWKVQLRQLEQQVKVSEHRVKAKEKLLERMQAKLQEQADKDELSKSRERTLFTKLQQRMPRKNSAVDAKHIELIHMYERQRNQMQEEIQSLQSQVQSLCRDVRDKENETWQSKQRTRVPYWNPDKENEAREEAETNENVYLLERFEQARRDQEKASLALRAREEAIQSKV